MFGPLAVLCLFNETSQWTHVITNNVMKQRKSLNAKWRSEATTQENHMLTEV